MNFIYLDNAASTRMYPDVVDAMRPYLESQYGNPSSIHRGGRMARKAVETARKQVARLINATPREIVFTSGGTESNNMALCGAALAASETRRACRIITSSIEHDAVLEPCMDLARRGTASVEYLPVDRRGTVDIRSLAKLLGVDENSDCDGDCDGSVNNGDGHGGGSTNAPSGSAGAAPRDPRLKPPAAPDPASGQLTLVSVMYANNEVGTIQPVREIARMCRVAGALFHTDAVQAAGKIPVDVKSLGVDMMSVSSHKIHGPKGVGALYVRAGTSLAPHALGGGQEDGMRSGTENVAGIVGFGAAARIARDGIDIHMSHTRALRDLLICRILEEIPQSALNGDPAGRLPGNSHFTFLGVNGEDLLVKLDEYGVAASTGSACSVHTQKASHVLQAMGFTHEQITGSLRLTPDTLNTGDEVDRAVDILKRAVAELRAVSPFKSKYGFDA